MSSTYQYSGVTPQGLRLSGTIEAPDEESARHQLHAMQLQLSEVAPTGAARPSAAVSGEDFIAFNQQLAHLTHAGLPVEQGLRLIADDLRSGKLKSTVNQVAAELERGTPLPDAFAKFRNQFPPLYSQLMDAGVRSNNLTAMLLNIGRHADMVQRLRAAVWKSLAYPTAMLVGFAVVATFIGWMVLPQIEEMVRAMGRMGFDYSWRRRSTGMVQMPMITQIFMIFAQVLPYLCGGVALVLAICFIVWPMIRNTSLGIAIIDRIVLRLPLFGAPMRWNLLARWCDAARVAVDAGTDLPAALNLAADAVASPRLQRDTREIIEAIAAGHSTQQLGKLDLLPATVPATLDHATRRGELATALSTLTTLYQQQAEVRLNSVGTILTPLVTIPIALLIGGAILAVMLPIISLIQAISG